jgi:hypothetical protein
MDDVKKPAELEIKPLWQRIPKSFKIFGGLIAVVLVVWLIVGFLPWWTTTDTRASALGDSFGVVAALFSGLAFAGVIYAIMLQSEELRLQRQELRLQRKELEQTNEELKRSADAQEQTQRALYLSAYLNAAANVLSGLGSMLPREMNDRHSPATMAFRKLLTELQGTLDELKLGASKFIHLPNLAEAICSQLAFFARCAESVRESDCADPAEKYRRLNDFISVLKYNLQELRTLLVPSDNDEWGRQSDIDFLLRELAGRPEQANADRHGEVIVETKHLTEMHDYVGRIAHTLKSIAEK